MKRRERTLVTSTCVFPATMPEGLDDPPTGVTLRIVHQLNCTSASIISIAIMRIYLRHYRLHRLLIATDGAIRHLGTRSYMDTHDCLLCDTRVCVDDTIKHDKYLVIVLRRVDTCPL